MDPNTHPIACSLSADDYRARLQQLATLASNSLLQHEMRGSTLTLRYAPDASARVREMVQQESACCAFLRFEVYETENAVTVTIEAPDDAHEALPELFEHLTGPPDTKSSARAR